MRTKDINGIIHDIIYLLDWKNPLDRINVKNSYSINLLNGEIDSSKEDSITEILEQKRKWFVDRIQKLGGNIEDFQKAIIIMKGNKERVEIVYKNKKFGSEKMWGEWMKK